MKEINLSKDKKEKKKIAISMYEYLNSKKKSGRILTPFEKHVQERCAKERSE